MSKECADLLEASGNAKAGNTVDVSFDEMMDQEGNFYTENHRSTKYRHHYTCMNLGAEQSSPSG